MDQESRDRKESHQAESRYQEESHQEEESGSQLERRKKSMVKQTAARVASYCAIILLASTTVSFSFSILPIKLVDSNWHLRVIAGALTSSPIILIAGLFLLIASVVDRQNRSHNQYMADYIRFTSVWSIFLLLLIPIQIFVGHKALNKQVEPIINIVADLKRYSTGIRATSNEAELRQYLSSIPNGPTLPERLSLPYETVKQRALTNLQAKINSANADIESRKSSSTQTFALEALRNSIQAILMFLAFNKINKLRGIFRKSLEGVYSEKAWMDT